jgi:hypothetical protein
MEVPAIHPVFAPSPLVVFQGLAAPDERILVGRWDNLREFYYKIRNYIYISLRRRKMVRGDGDGLIGWLMERADRAKGDLWSNIDWPDFQQTWGRRNAQAVQAGLKSYWKRHAPLLPHEKPSPNQTARAVVFGLAGLHLAWEGGELQVATVTDSGATLLAGYAMNELNGFPPWFPALLEAKPVPVGAVVSECVRNAFSPEKSFPRPSLACWASLERRDLRRDSIYSHSW